MAELLIGCGNRRDRAIILAPEQTGWSDLTTLDLDPNCGADIEWDLERFPLPFKDDQFDEIHAYHVLEHTGRQGDYRFFFAQWSEFWRILKPGGSFVGVVPAPGTAWVWGDPGHTRAVSQESFTFLDQSEYSKQVGVTVLADYRHIYRADFTAVFGNVKEDSFFFGLTAIKPSRISV
jgi:SAM-dependent methyltransferase